MIKRNKNGSFVKGHKHPKKWLEINRNKHLGKRRSQATKDKIRKHNAKFWLGKVGNQVREKHWNWRGGLTSLNNQIRSCFKYRQWRSDVFTRDNFTCQECGSRGGKIHPHHVKGFAMIIKDNNIKTFDEAQNCEELWKINNGFA